MLILGYSNIIMIKTQQSRYLLIFFIYKHAQVLLAMNCIGMLHTIWIQFYDGRVSFLSPILSLLFWQNGHFVLLLLLMLQKEIGQLLAIFTARKGINC